MRITKHKLQMIAACPEQVQKFSKIFPKGCILNEKNIIKASNAGLNVRWFASIVLYSKPYWEAPKSFAKNRAKFLRDSSTLLTRSQENELWNNAWTKALANPKNIKKEILIYSAPQNYAKITIKENGEFVYARNKKRHN